VQFAPFADEKQVFFFRLRAQNSDFSGSVLLFWLFAVCPELLISTAMKAKRMYSRRNSNFPLLMKIQINKPETADYTIKDDLGGIRKLCLVASFTSIRIFFFFSPHVFLPLTKKSTKRRV